MDTVKKIRVFRNFKNFLKGIYRYLSLLRIGMISIQAYINSIRLYEKFLVFFFVLWNFIYNLKIFFEEQNVSAKNIISPYCCSSDCI